MTNNTIHSEIGGPEIGSTDLYSTELQTEDIEVFIAALRRYWDALDECDFEITIKVTEK